ncbi:hypothetical protein IKG45_01805 [Candidatus Saccharibacteria bacterium]|nr:hypothetical protein [Candidatus Saccharibacteria bacterium]
MDQEGQEQQPTSVSSEAGALKTSEKGTKKTYKILIPVLIIVALAGVGFGIYGMFFKPDPTVSTCPTCVAENTEKSEEQTTQESSNPTETTNTNSPQSEHKEIPRRIFTVSNASGAQFSGYIDTKIWYYDGSNKDGNYYIYCEISSCTIVDENGEKYATIDNFSGKVISPFFAVFGQAAGSEVILFLMEDGTVEYMPMTAFKDNLIKSYGKVDGLSNIIGFHQASLSPYVGDDENGNPIYAGGGAETLAEDINGNFYSLYSKVHK